LYPFILRDLTVEHFWSNDMGRVTDIVSPYGYGGPYAWGDRAGEGIAERFWGEFDDWARGHNVVSELVTLSLFHESLLKYPGMLEQKLLNVVRDLDISEKAIFEEFKPELRTDLRKAMRIGVNVECDAVGQRMEDFIRLYRYTLDRRGAGMFYYFPDSYFERIHKDLAGQFMYFHAIHRGRLVSTALALLSVNNVYDFLGGTDAEGFEVRANDLLKYDMIRWAKSQGKQRVVLGGGKKDGDGIYRYKLKFAPKGVKPFFIGCRIFCKELYERLVENRRASSRALGSEWVPEDGYFPEYRG